MTLCKRRRSFSKGPRSRASHPRKNPKVIAPKSKKRRSKIKTTLRSKVPSLTCMTIPRRRSGPTTTRNPAYAKSTPKLKLRLASSRYITAVRIPSNKPTDLKGRRRRLINRSADSRNCTKRWTQIVRATVELLTTTLQRSVRRALMRAIAGS